MDVNSSDLFFMQVVLKIKYQQHHSKHFYTKKVNLLEKYMQVCWLEFK